MCRLYDELKQSAEMSLQTVSVDYQASSVTSESLHKQVLLLNKVVGLLQCLFCVSRNKEDYSYSLQERNNYIELLEQTSTELEHAKQSEHVSVILSQE